MIDFAKLFFQQLHTLPSALRYAFVALFFTSAVVLMMAFKGWLESRRENQETDFWRHMPIGLSLTQVMLWVVWATASFYASYEDPAKVEAAKAPAVQAALAHAGVKPVGHLSHWAESRRHTAEVPGPVQHAAAEAAKRLEPKPAEAAPIEMKTRMEDLAEASAPEHKPVPAGPRTNAAPQHAALAFAAGSRTDIVPSGRFGSDTQPSPAHVAPPAGSPAAGLPAAEPNPAPHDTMMPHAAVSSTMGAAPAPTAREDAAGRQPANAPKPAATPHSRLAHKLRALKHKLAAISSMIEQPMP